MRRRKHRAGPTEEESGGIPLTALAAGRGCEVVRVRARRRSRIDLLATYGVIPGALLVLQQKLPTFVVRVGETDLALDEEIASDILVRPQAAPSDQPGL